MVLAELEDVRIKNWDVPLAGGERLVTVNERWSAFGTVLVSMSTDRELLYPASVVFCLVNRQGWWYQTRAFELSGKRTFKLDMTGTSGQWFPVGHLRPWDGFAPWRVVSFGVKVFPLKEPVRLSLDSVELLPDTSRMKLQVFDLRMPAEASVGQLMEVAFRIEPMPSNPFDPREADIQGWFDLGGREETVPGFFYQGFEQIAEGSKSRLVPVGPGVWKLRYVPHCEGTLKLKVRVSTPSGKRSFSGKVACRKSAPKPSSPVEPAPDFIVLRNEEKYLVEYALKDGWEPAKFSLPERNLRAWRAPIEWTEAWGPYAGAGRYSLEVAWLLDQAILHAPQSLPLLLCENEPFGDREKFNWKDNPLNAENGGPLKAPSDFYRDDKAFELFTRRLRYVIARWGFAPAVTGWEVWLDIPSSGVEDWHKKLAGFLKGWQTERHPIRSYHPQATEPDQLAAVSDFERDINWSVAWDISKTPAAAAPSEEHSSQGSRSLSLRGQYPGEIAIRKRIEQDWSAFNRLAFDVYLPPDAPRDMRVMIYLRDPDLWWYESLLPPYLRPGDWTRLIVDLSGRSLKWVPQGHTKPYSPDLLWCVKEVGLRFFGHRKYEGSVYVDNVSLWRAREPREPLMVRKFSVNRRDVPLYEKFEITMQLTKSFSNPFDPDVVDLQAHFLAPSGRVISVPGFFYQGYDRTYTAGREGLVAKDESSWKVRFTPTELGQYSYYVTVNQSEFFRGGQWGQEGFQCVPSSRKGFVRRSLADRKYFEFDNGEPFYPIGENLRSPTDSRQYHLVGPQPEGQGTYAYDRYFQKMAENRMNWTRVWMCPWWCGLEWTKLWPGYHGTGRFNLENAWRLDYLVEKAESLGIAMELCLINHGQFSLKIDREWPLNPYNLARNEGGMLPRARDFFLRSEADAAIKKRFRYAVARWGYSTAVMNWALFSEVEFTEIYAESTWDRIGWRRCPPLQQWHERMASYLKAIDPQRRLVTTHFSHPWRGQDIWTLDGLDFSQSNAYSGFAEFGVFSARNAVAAMDEYYSRYMGRYGKPVLVAEWGGHWMKNDPISLEADLHCGLWACVTSPMAGNTGFWWWHFTDRLDKYSHYRAVARFMEGEDRRGKNLASAPCPVTPPLKARALLNTSQADVWVYHPAVLKSLADLPTIRGAAVEIMGLDPGEYSIEFWNTYTGEVFQRAVQKAPLQVQLPLVRGDLALKIRRK